MYINVFFFFAIMQCYYHHLYLWFVCLIKLASYGCDFMKLFDVLIQKFCW
jgi:hypothetical protein